MSRDRSKMLRCLIFFFFSFFFHVCRGNQYEVGSVVKVGYREDSWPLDKPDAPYQVKLDKGALIYAPEDIDEYILEHDESWAKQLPPGSPWYLQPGALDRELAKIGAYR